MSDTTTSPRDEEIEKQVYDITQKMLVALSEWQAGVPLNYEGVKKQGRAELLQLIHAHDATREREILQLVGTAGAHACYCSYSTSDCSCALTDSLRATTNQLPNDVKEEG